MSTKEPKRQGKPEAGHTMSTPRILVIDDDLDTLDLMRDILVAEGYDVACVTEVDADLRQIHEDPPSC
jgi:DNA-binding response OmpR family regulator